MKKQSSSRRKGIVATKTKTAVVTTGKTPIKRKASVLDWIAEPRPTTPPRVINDDIVPPMIVEALDNGDMLRITKGEMKIDRRVYNQFSPVYAEEHEGLPDLPLSSTVNVDLVFTIPRALLQRTQMICCVIEETVMTVTAFD